MSSSLIVWSDDLSGMKIATAAERQELLEPAWERTRDAFPEYNNHGVWLCFCLRAQPEDPPALAVVATAANSAFYAR